MTNTKTFVLVHGSWQGAWCWDGVRNHLRARGHRVITPALPGRGAYEEDRSWIGHDDNVAAVLAALDADADGAGPAVLVGHSLSGMTISQVADQRPDRIARLVYCDAFIPEDGESAADLLPEEFRGAISGLAASRADRSIPIPWEVWRANFIQTASEQLARESYQRLVPDPYRPVFEPVKLSRPVHRELPVTFLAFTQDLSLPPGPAYWHPGMTGRLNGATITQIDGDHEIMLTAPELLADALHQAAME
jgi:pimeloyl-ACP methyl ester carboxylesterase